MALEEYRRKRDFSKTPEPAPSKAKRHAGARHYVIQKHAARRLHYDFRLENDGVMWSWAVPKGPSLDPGEKRLAVHTEDHPLEYNDFEGVIPKGEYGGGTVLLWDRGTWTPLDPDPAAAHRKGALKFRLEGEKLHGNWALIKLRGRRDDGKDNWLLIKEKDETAAPGSGSAVVDENPLSVATGRDIEAIAKASDRVWHSNRGDGEGGETPRVDPATLEGARRGKLPKIPAPQLATAAEAPPRGEGWLHELKLDGYRILARIESGEVVLFSRNALDWTDRFPRIAHEVASLPVETALLDGEIVQLGEDGTSSFAGLQKALSEGNTDKLVYYVFDLIHLDGWSLSEVRLEKRKEALKALLPSGGIRYSDHFAGDGAEFFQSACNFKIEGVVSKRADAPYRPGRSRAWLKVKCVNRDEFVIVGFTDPSGSRVGFGALLVGYYDESGKLRYAGRVGTGFDDELLASMHRRLVELERKTRPVAALPKGVSLKGVHWVEPRLVAEVRYSDWTTDGMLRHPVFIGLREDKDPKEIVLRPGRTGATPAPAAVSWDGSLEIEGVRLTNAEKVLYPGEGITKLDLARYYTEVAEHALKHLSHRPLTLVRCPNGQGKPCFYQKHVGSGVPDALHKVEVEEREGGMATYLVIEDLRGLLATVQMGVLELHPWGSTVDDTERPDRLYFDLDPDPGLPWDAIIEAAVEVRERLTALGLESFAKTTGGKGLHVVVPIKPSLEWDAAKEFTRLVVERLAAEHPQRYTANLSKKARAKRIFIDYLRNGRGNTAVGAYSTRARPGATVSMPVTWAEVESGIRSDAFTVRTAPERLKRLKSDPWAPLLETRQTITKATLRKLKLA